MALTLTDMVNRLLRLTKMVNNLLRLPNCPKNVNPNDQLFVNLTGSADDRTQERGKMSARMSIAKWLRSIANQNGLVP